jgi:Flp pilus assembly protein TadD
VHLALCVLLTMQLQAQVAPDSGLATGLALFDAGNRTAAIPLLEPYGKTSAVAAFDLGLAALDDGRYGPAVDWFERAVALDPDNPK